MAKQRTTEAPTSADEAAFLNAIIGEPGEDTHRLVYADWLQEHGRPERAEFIRLQCRLEGADAHEDLEDLEARKDELRDRHGEEWASEFRVRGVEEARFYRGFVERVSATGFCFLTHQDAWFRRTPLRRLALTSAAGRTCAIAGSPHLHRLESLSIKDDQLRDGDLAGLVAGRGGVAATQYPNLSSLSLSAGVSLGSAGLTEFAASAQLPRLKSLTVGNNSVCDDGAEALAAAEGFDELDSIFLGGSLVGDNGLAALLTSPRRASLTHLSLSSCQVTGVVLAELADMPLRPNFEHLRLELNPIEWLDMSRLAVALTKYPKLRLDLRQCPIPRPLREEVHRRFGERVFVDAPAPPSPRRRRITG